MFIELEYKQVPTFKALWLVFKKKKRIFMKHLQ